MRYLLLLMPPLIWSTMLVAGQAILYVIPPATLTFWTWLTATVCLLPVAWKYLKVNLKNIRQEFWILFCFALFGISGFQYLLFFGLSQASAISASVLSPTIPILVACLGWRFLGEKLQTLQILGIFISFAGVCWISSFGDWKNLQELDLGSGELLILTANLSMAVYTIMLVKYPSKLPPVLFMFVIAFMGTIQTIPLSLVEIPFITGALQVYDFIWVILYIGIVNYCLAYVFWNLAVRRFGASTTGIYLYLVPVFGTFFSYLVFRDSLLAHHFIGALLIFTGLYFSLHFVNTYRNNNA